MDSEPTTRDHFALDLREPQLHLVKPAGAVEGSRLRRQVGLAIPATNCPIVGARSFPGNPYDGDTLAEPLEQVEILSGHNPGV